VTGTGDAGSYNVIINQSAANVFTPTGSSIAIKTDDFSGNLTTSGSVILANGSILSNNTVSAPNVLQDIPTNLSGVTITGNLTYNTNTAITVQLTDCDIQGTVSNTGSAQVNIVKVNSTIGTVGTNVVAQQFATVSAPNLIAGSRVRVYDEDNSVELFNGVLASAGFSQSFVYDGDITVTLTAAYVNGATAKLGVSTTGLLTASGVTFLDAQDDDLVYNANGIDGTTVTEFTFDYPNVQVDINDPDGATTITRLYAWWANERTTEHGIRTLIGGLIAEDAANYKVITSVVDLKLDNVAATGVIFTGDVRLYRDDGLAPVVASDHRRRVDHAVCGEGVHQHRVHRLARHHGGYCRRGAARLERGSGILSDGGQHGRGAGRCGGWWCYGARGVGVCNPHPHGIERPERGCHRHGCPVRTCDRNRPDRRGGQQSQRNSTRQRWYCGDQG
jgi:hypothetical protein